MIGAFVVGFGIGFGLALIERVRRPVESLEHFGLALALLAILGLAAVFRALARVPRGPSPAAPRSPAPRPLDAAIGTVRAEATQAAAEATQAAAAPARMDATEVAAGLARHAGRP